MTFFIRSLRVGNTVVQNVKAGVVSSKGSLLLGQSFLERFKSWSIDNTKGGLNFPAHRNLRVSEGVENLLR